jgi:hypothetical protein
VTRTFCAALAVICAGAAHGQEFVAVDGPLQNEDFYRLIACGAAPGAACTKPMVFWPEDKRAALSVGFVTLSDTLQPYQRRLFEEALAKAVAQVNGLGAGLRLVTAADPDVQIHVVATGPGEVMRNTGVPTLDGALLPLGRVAIRTRSQVIHDAVIAISAQTARRAIASVVLEELVQALGLMTDIRSPAYRRSVFAEDSNSGTRLTGQDAMVIRRHYPPN